MYDFKTSTDSCVSFRLSEKTLNFNLVNRQYTDKITNQFNYCLYKSIYTHNMYAIIVLLPTKQELTFIEHKAIYSLICKFAIIICLTSEDICYYKICYYIMKGNRCQLYFSFYKVLFLIALKSHKKTSI